MRSESYYEKVISSSVTPLVVTALIVFLFLDIFMDMFPVTTIISSGSSVHFVELPLNVNAFLQIGASFEVTITDVSLIGVSPVVLPSSPILGARSSITLPVTTDVANGEIGFQVFGTPLVVEEPLGSDVTEVSCSIPTFK